MGAHRLEWPDLRGRMKYRIALHKSDEGFAVITVMPYPQASDPLSSSVQSAEP